MISTFNLIIKAFLIYVFFGCYSINQGSPTIDGDYDNLVSASIKKDITAPYKLVLTIRNNSSTSICIGKELSTDTHEIVLKYPDGRKFQMPTNLSGRCQRLEKDEELKYFAWDVANTILSNKYFNNEDKGSYETGIYIITWKNIRLGIDISHEYFFDIKTYKKGN